MLDACNQKAHQFFHQRRLSGGQCRSKSHHSHRQGWGQGHWSSAAVNNWFISHSAALLHGVRRQVYVTALGLGKNPTSLSATPCWYFSCFATLLGCSTIIFLNMALMVLNLWYGHQSSSNKTGGESLFLLTSKAKLLITSLGGVSHPLIFCLTAFAALHKPAKDYA